MSSLCAAPVLLEKIDLNDFSPCFQWVDEVKRTEKKEKEAKLKEQKSNVRRSPRTIDIQKFYKESSSSGEEKATAKVLFRLNPFPAASASILLISSIQVCITLAVKFPVDWSLWADPPPGLVVGFFLSVLFCLVCCLSVSLDLSETNEVFKVSSKTRLWGDGDA